MRVRKILYALAGLLATYGIAWAATQTLTLGGNTGPGGVIVLFGSTSGSATIQTPAAAGTGTVLQIPAWAATGNAMAIDIPDQVITGGAEVTTQSQSAGNITIDCTTRPMQYIPNTGAFTLTAPAKDSSCFFDMENGVGAGAVTLSGFSPNTMGGDALDTTNGHNFRLFVSRNHGHSTIFARALQ